jgi:Mrp family chromosome partitioning ATPase
MTIWEDVYSKHKGTATDPCRPQSGQSPQNPQQQNPIPADPLSQPQKPAGAASFEEIYYGTGKPQTASQQSPAPAPQPQVREPQPQAAPAAGTPVKARFIPRISVGKLTTPYPAILAKMRNALSDCWANILVETQQSVETLLLCGATRKEGTTLISYHLAMFLAKEYNMKVLYVDTNLNHTAIAKTQNLPGLYSFVAEGKALAPLIVQTEYPGFYLLPSGAGKVPKNVGTNMLSREPILTLLEFCRNNFAMTIIDGQPLTSSPVMVEFARAVDLTLLVCRYGYSRQEVSKLAIDKLQKLGITSIGAIFNDRKFPVPQQLYRLMG